VHHRPQPLRETPRNVDRAGCIDAGNAFGRTHVRTDSSGVDYCADVTSFRLRALKQLLDGGLVGDVANHADCFNSGNGQLAHRNIEAGPVEVGQHDSVVVTHEPCRCHPHAAGPTRDDRSRACSGHV
jgi:hypothetical protein